jgi:small subunit ribosomal protein S12
MNNILRRKAVSHKRPQKKATCYRVLTMSPKKPNSANRKIVKTNTVLNKFKLIVRIPGEGHNLQQHSTILFKPCRARDLIGVIHGAVRGRYDLLAVSDRRSSRSVYGVKRNKNN